MLSRFALLIPLLATPFATAAADDWPQWGGPERDLVWRETGIVETLPTDGLLPRVWSTPIAEGYSGPAVADGKVYVTDRLAREELERVHCLDADTGKILWTHKYPCRYSIGYPFGPRSTPVVDGDRVYTIGAQGNMFCLNVADGKPVWSKDFVKDFDTFLPKWGMVAAPLVDGDQLITLVGGKKGALLVSFNKHTGKEIWRSLEDRVVGYGTPLFMNFGGRRQLIVWHAKALSALDPADGKVIWEYPFDVNYGLTVPLPRKHDNRLFITAFYEGPRMLEVAEDGRSAKLLWRGHATSETEPDGIHSIMSTPVFTGSHVYGVSSYGQMMCQDADTGKVLWSTYEATGQDRWWNVFFIPHEDRYFLHNQQGDLIIAELSPEGYNEISRAKLVEPTRKVRRNMTIWSHPAFAMKSVFARNDKEIVRVNLAR